MPALHEWARTLKVLLLKPRWPYPISREESTYNRIWPPLSLAYSAALLEREGIQAEILDAHAERLSGSRLASRLSGFNKIFITSSDLDRWLCPNLDLTPVVETTRLANSLCREVYLMGQHGTVDPEGMLRLTGVKAVIRGEPEFTVRDMCLSAPSENVPGVSCRSNGSFLSTPARALVSMDQLPLPAWHLLPLGRYAYELLGDRFMLMETARGCSFHCTFCAKGVMYGPGVRRHSLGRVLQEIDLAVTRHRVRSLYFYDLEFLIHRRYVEELCQALIQRQYPLSWCCQTRVTHVDEPILARMKQAGCRLIHFGVESGSPSILDRIRKEIALKDAERAVHLTRQAGIETLCFFLVGFDGEVFKEMQATFRFARKLNPTYVSFHLVSSHEAIQPHPAGSGKILALREDSRCFDRALKRLVRRALLRFYLRPSSLLYHLFRALSGGWRMFGMRWRLFRGYLFSGGPTG